MPIILLAFGLVVFTNCEKQELKNDQNVEPVTNDNSSLSKVLETDIKRVNGILQYKDRNHFEKVYNALEQSHNKWIAENVNSKDMKSSSEYIDSMGFYKSSILQKFENYNNFLSLRKQIAKEERKWLSQEELDFETEPDNHYITDEILRTMINPQGEFMLGDSIYKVDDNFTIYCILNANFGVLNDLRLILNDQKEFKSATTITNDSSVLNKVYIAQLNGNDLTDNMENIGEKVKKSSFISDNNSNIRSKLKSLSMASSAQVYLKSNASSVRQWSYDNGGKFIKGRVTVTNVFTGQHYLKGTTRSYKRKSTWFASWWGKYNVHQKVRLYGYYYKDHKEYELDPVIDETWGKKAKAKITFDDETVRIASGRLGARHKNYDDGYKLHYNLLDW